MTSVLVVAPHADDETLGAGGTIARLAASGCTVRVAVMTGRGPGDHHPVLPDDFDERIQEEARRAFDLLGVADARFLGIPAVAVAQQPLWQLNAACLEVLEWAQPETLFVPFQFDLHEDHRALLRSFSVAWRPSSEVGRRIREIHCYETVSETHWNLPNVEADFTPNVWSDISDTLQLKLDALSCFRSQIHDAPGARSLQAVRSLAVWRGSQVGCEAAEAFVQVRRLL